MFLCVLTPNLVHEFIYNHNVNVEDVDRQIGRVLELKCILCVEVKLSHSCVVLALHIWYLVHSIVVEGEADEDCGRVLVNTASQLVINAGDCACIFIGSLECDNELLLVCVKEELHGVFRGGGVALV